VKAVQRGFCDFFFYGNQAEPLPIGLNDKGLQQDNKRKPGFYFFG
jgi:hypothetical protein